jgi:hypothetical protein
MSNQPARQIPYISNTLKCHNNRSQQQLTWQKFTSLYCNNFHLRFLVPPGVSINLVNLTDSALERLPSSALVLLPSSGLEGLSSCEELFSPLVMG